MNTRLELVWPNKDKFLLVPRDADGKPVWVEPTHPAASEVRLARITDAVGEVGDDPYADNLLFTGDSLDVLRILTEVPEYRRHYRGKVKLVYIDPPFNTGQTFTNYDDWMEHSTWLTFMRDRLLLIKDLIAPDGSVWVHLDDVEVHRMRAVMDETFGADNFVAEVVWQKADSPRSDASGLSISHDSLLVYKRSAAWKPNRLARRKSTDATFGNQDGDPVLWRKKDPTAPSAATHQGMVYAVQHPISGAMVYPGVGRCWAMEQTWMLKEMSRYARYELREIDDADDRARICGVAVSEVRSGVKALVLTDALEIAAAQARAVYDAGTWPSIYLTGPNGSRGFQRKQYISDTGRVPETWWPHEEVGHNRSAKNEIKALFEGQHPFATPKPERLLQRVLQVSTEPGDIVLDCFGGSGTTAAVAHKMGRRWVTCEIVPNTVATFTRPRLEKVVDGSDRGGISVPPTSVRPVEDLPDHIAPDDIKLAAATLKTLTEAGLLAVDAVPEETHKRLQRLAKTKKADGGDAWEGGGGFRTVEVGPSMYEVGPGGMVLLADWATNGTFSRAVAGQLGFEYDDAGPFCGRRGRMRLAVLDGAVGPEEVADLVSRLDDRERLTIVAKAVLPTAEETLAKLSPGSRVKKAPRDLLTPPRRRRTAQPEDTP